MTFAAITTLPKTTHNISTHNTGETSSNYSVKLSLSPHKSSHGTFLDSLTVDLFKIPDVNQRLKRRHTAPAFCTIFTGLPVRPVIKWAFGRRCQKVVSRGREDTRVWYRETMFSQMVSYEFLLHEPLHGYFLYLVCAPPEKPTKRCEPEEGYLRCSKRFDHGSHSIIFLLFEFKSVR